ncbi:YggT family protein [Paractinoplanes atraurantiacus]|uniref:YggT family protein n=1 Tax=Paractinoplanes atraurantiacus TaxID=1036182 RepID=A0A285IT19_9ACTN|nr:YggT family protein [Actinoplanes atraurantiacus]
MGEDSSTVLSVVFQILYLLVYIFFLVLLARFVLGAVLQYGRRWQPSRGASAALETVWSVTDPPLKALRRVIPPLRIGNVSLDLASIVLLVILFVLMRFVLQRLILNFS